MHLVVALPSDKQGHLSADGMKTLCGMWVGYELSKTVWKKKPLCVECRDK